MNEAQLINEWPALARKEGHRPRLPAGQSSWKVSDRSIAALLAEGVPVRRIMKDLGVRYDRIKAVRDQETA